MARTARRAIPLAAALLALAGCGSVVDLGASGGRVYGGVRLDYHSLVAAPRTGQDESYRESPTIPAPGLDLPFSALLDTLLLPYTGIRALLQPGVEDQESYNKEDVFAEARRDVDEEGLEEEPEEGEKGEEGE